MGRGIFSETEKTRLAARVWKKFDKAAEKAERRVWNDLSPLP